MRKHRSQGVEKETDRSTEEINSEKQKNQKSEKQCKLRSETPVKETGLNYQIVFTSVQKDITGNLREKSFTRVLFMKIFSDAGPPATLQTLQNQAAWKTVFGAFIFYLGWLILGF